MDSPPCRSPSGQDAPESLTFHRPGLDSQVPGTTYKPCSTMLPPVTFSPAHLPTCPGHWALCSSSNTPHLPLALPAVPPTLPQHLHCLSFSLYSGLYSNMHPLRACPEHCLKYSPPSKGSLNPRPALFLVALIITCLCSLSGFHCPRLDSPRSRT